MVDMGIGMGEDVGSRGGRMKFGIDRNWWRFWRAAYRNFEFTLATMGIELFGLRCIWWQDRSLSAHFEITLFGFSFWLRGE